MSEECDQYVEKERKSPIEMVNRIAGSIQSLQPYLSAVTREQDYVALLQSEMLKRMKKEAGTKGF